GDRQGGGDGRRDHRDREGARPPRRRVAGHRPAVRTDGRNHTPTDVGARLRPTTLRSSPPSRSTSNSSRRCAAKPSTVRSASYRERLKRRSIVDWSRRLSGWERANAASVETATAMVPPPLVNRARTAWRSAKPTA